MVCLQPGDKCCRFVSHSAQVSEIVSRVVSHSPRAEETVSKLGLPQFAQIVQNALKKIANFGSLTVNYS